MTDPSALVGSHNTRIVKVTPASFLYMRQGDKRVSISGYGNQIDTAEIMLDPKRGARVRDRMFITTGDGCRIACRLDGPEEAPVLLLSNSLGTDMGM